MKLFKLYKLALVCGLLMSSFANANPLFSLENLERERASLLATLSDQSIGMDERARKSAGIYRRIADIERMVLRDERISNSDRAIVKKAFENYELTFLVHASAENQLQPMSHWLETLNINTRAIDKARVGVR